MATGWFRVTVTADVNGDTSSDVVANSGANGTGTNRNIQLGLSMTHNTGDHVFGPWLLQASDLSIIFNTHWAYPGTGSMHQIFQIGPTNTGPWTVFRDFIATAPAGANFWPDLWYALPGSGRVTQAELIILLTQAGFVRATQVEVIVLIPITVYTPTVSLSQAQSVSLIAETIAGSYACLEALTYGQMEAYTYGQLQAGGACFNAFTLTVATTQGQALRLVGTKNLVLPAAPQTQAVSLASQSRLTRVLTQAQALQVRAQAIFRRTVSTTQAQTPGTLLKAIRLVRRIPQQQNTPLVSRVILHSRQYKRTGTARQTEVVQRGGIFRTVTTTQAQSVRLVRQPRLVRRVTQSQTVRLVRGIAKILATTQAQALSLRLRNSSLVLAITQATSATLARQSAALSGIVLQASNALVLVQARLTRVAQQAAESLSLVIGGQVLQRTGSTTQATNVSLTKQLFATPVAQQPQTVSLILGSGVLAGTATQAQACTLIVQPIPSTPVQPARVFAACHARRLVYAAPARRTTFSVRPRETVFVARFS